MRLVLIACAILLLKIGSCSDTETQAEPPPRLVRAIVVTPDALSAANDTVGDIEPRHTGNLGFQVGGRLVERLVDTGATVHKGQVLARVDSADQKNKLLSAEAQVRAAQAAVEQAVPLEARYRQLLSGGYTTPQRYEETKKRLQQSNDELADAQAQLAFARDQLGYTELIAPGDGVVLSTGADPGQVVSAGQMVVQVADPKEREGAFSVSDTVIGLAYVGMKIKVTLKGDPSVTTVGTIREIAPNADPVTRTYPVKVSLPDAPEAMRLGAIVLARPVIDAQTAIRIPSGALLQTGQAPAVWVIEGADHQVRRRTVKVLRFDTDAVLISEGLKNGDVVVTAGINSLAENEKVRLPPDLAKADSGKADPGKADPGKAEPGKAAGGK
jgi:RND family efflux transporter MFP subunit